MTVLFRGKWSVMSQFYETANFVVEAPGSPHVDRLEGGHVVIYPRVRVVDRTHLEPALAIELMKLTMMVGEAMNTALNRRGIDVVRINYQDNGNWGWDNAAGPALHVHLYGRAKSARVQKYTEALQLPRTPSFYEGVSPLNEGDIAAMREEIERLAATTKYREFPTG